MKKNIFIFLIPIVILILAVSLLLVLNSKNNNMSKIMSKTNEKNFVKKNIDDNVEIKQSSKKVEEVENNEIMEIQQYDNEIKVEKNKEYVNNIDTDNQNVDTNKTNNNSSMNTSIQTNVQTRALTEWEKLGISEWDYYHTPAPNEGELATGISDCDNEANNIISKYKVVAHSGDTYSYSDDYLGCWIVIVFSDNSRIFYNEFRSREKTGEFNYLLRNTN